MDSVFNLDYLFYIWTLRTFIFNRILNITFEYEFLFNFYFIILMFEVHFCLTHKEHTGSSWLPSDFNCFLKG